MARDWFGYWAGVYEDPEAYQQHFGGYGDEDDFDLDADDGEDEEMEA